MSHKRHLFLVVSGTARFGLKLAGQAIFESKAGTMARKTLSDGLAKSEDHVHMMARVSVSHTPLKDLGHWVPPTLIAQQCLPDSTSTLGRPWVWKCRPGGFRAGPGDWLSFGIGQFVFGHEGQSVLLVCKAHSLLQLGISLPTASQRMGRMSSDDLEQLIEARAVQHATLTASTVVWVPYGWVPMAMACPVSPGDAVATHAFLPYFNEDLCHLARRTMRAVLDSLESYLADPDLKGQSSRTPKDIEGVSGWLTAALESADGSDSSAPEEGVPTPGREESPPAAAAPEGQSLRARKRQRLSDGQGGRQVPAVQSVGQAVPGAVSGHHGQGDSEASRGR